MPVFSNLTRCIAIATLILVTELALEESARAQILIPVQDQSRVDVTISVNVQFDTATDQYMYDYQVTSSNLSEQNVWSFAVEADAEIENIQSPAGWSAQRFFDKPITDWTATVVEPLPPDYVDDGNLPPSPFDIKPGETLAGFSFQSPEPPTTAIFYAQGFALLPTSVSEGDFDLAGIEIPKFTENSFIGSTVGPGLDDNIIFAGGRRPAVDGFLGFVGLAGDRETLLRPVTMVVRFGVNGETVDTSTFLAELNRVGVTGSFTPTGNADELLAVFDLADSPLVIGRNVLFTSVEGTVPGTTRTAADTDRLTFFVD